VGVGRALFAGRFGAVLAGLSLSALGAQAEPTASQIIERHLEARGGDKRLRAVKDTRLRGTVNGSGEFLWATRAPSAFYLEVRSGEGPATFAFNGRAAWRGDAQDGVRTMTGAEQASARAIAIFRNRGFVDYKKDKTRVNRLGRDTVDGRSAYVVEVITTAGVRRKVFFDAQTFLISKEESPGDGGTEEILFSEYGTVDGMPEPGRIVIRRPGGETVDLAVQEAAHDVGVDAAMFDFPRQEGAPFPKFTVLFAEVLRNQEALATARENYAFTQTDTEIDTDSRGRVKEKRERTYEVFFMEGGAIRTLVAVNGHPLSDEEAREERERVTKVIREREERIPKAAEKKAGSDDPSLAHILRVCRFVNPRRERFRGRDALVYEFEPSPDEKAHGRVESWVQKLQGTVWIDEAAKGILRAEVRTTDSIKVVGGLLISFKPGASFVFEQELVNGETWLPTYTEVNAAARLLLVKGLEFRRWERFTDYKKFKVDAAGVAGDPAAAR